MSGQRGGGRAGGDVSRVVVQDLGMSLDESDEEDVEAAALREALRRSGEIDRGEVRVVAVAEAMERLRAGLLR
jgi:hypothetical protein